MPSYTTADIRNVLLVGHGGCGKTTIADALLAESKTVTRKGNVSDGSSYSDFEKEEKEHKHSIYSAVLHADHMGKRINLIDAPGSTDLVGAAIAAMPATNSTSPTGFISSGPLARNIDWHSRNTVETMLWPPPVSASSSGSR